MKILRTFIPQKKMTIGLFYSTEGSCDHQDEADGQILENSGCNIGFCQEKGNIFQSAHEGHGYCPRVFVIRLIDLNAEAEIFRHKKHGNGNNAGNGNSQGIQPSA